MTPPTPHRRPARLRLATVAAAVVATVVLALAGPASAESYVRISGAGSSWSANAINQWLVNVRQFGMRVDYSPTGSSDGRRQFLNGTVDFAASDIPFQFHPEDGSAPENPAAGSYAYMPVTAGGTVFMYNLTIGGKRVTNIRMSGENITKIFTGVVTKWNDPALVADNPGLAMPDKKIVPVVRSDGSGSTAQFSAWMIAQHKPLWDDYCTKTGRTGRCGETSYYPTSTGMIAQSGDLGVAGYVQQNYAEGAVGYVNYSYALNAGFPVVKMLNAAGYYTEPTPENVAVSLLKADLNRDESSPDYLSQKLDGVYNDSDARNYQLSSYSYMILPTKVQGQFNTDKGKTLGAFASYAMCQAQEQSASLGYSPMPINLVQASFAQIKKIPGSQVGDVDVASCKNPTFDAATGKNLLAENAPQPQACDKQGPTQCATGTGGARKIATATAAPGGATAAQGGTKAAAAATGAGTSPGAAKVATGAATGAGGAGTAAAAAAPGAGEATVSATAGGDAASAACDPDLGTCAATAAADGTGASADQVASGPLTLAASSGWGSTQTLMLLSALLLVGLVVGPALAAKRLARRRS